MTHECRILVVDDDEQLSQVICAALRTNGARPTWTGSLDGALRFLSVQMFDVVLLDLFLPDSPLERTMGAIPHLKAIGADAVVVITGATVTDALFEKAMEAGATDVICKNGEAFFERIQRLVHCAC